MTRVCSYCGKLILVSGNPSYSPRDAATVRTALAAKTVTHGICDPCRVEQHSLIAAKRLERQRAAHAQVS